MRYMYGNGFALAMRMVSTVFANKYDICCMRMLRVSMSYLFAKTQQRTFSSTLDPTVCCRHEDAPDFVAGRNARS